PIEKKPTVGGPGAVDPRVAEFASDLPRRGPKPTPAALRREAPPADRISNDVGLNPSAVQPAMVGRSPAKGRSPRQPGESTIAAKPAVETPSGPPPSATTPLVGASKLALQVFACEILRSRDEPFLAEPTIGDGGVQLPSPEMAQRLRGLLGEGRVFVLGKPCLLATMGSPSVVRIHPKEGEEADGVRHPGLMLEVTPTLVGDGSLQLRLNGAVLEGGKGADHGFSVKESSGPKFKKTLQATAGRSTAAVVFTLGPMNRVGGALAKMPVVGWAAKKAGAVQRELVVVVLPLRGENKPEEYEAMETAAAWCEWIEGGRANRTAGVPALEPSPTGVSPAGFGAFDGVARPAGGTR
ncbi:MAG: hypothetical protein ACRDD1_13470, partial [Planctomycetia bacterium]